MVHRIALACVLALALSWPAGAADYTIDPTHSFVQFRIKHIGISWLSGRFNRVEGTFTFDPAAGPAGQSVQVVIDTTSIDTNHAERDKHLRSADYFDVERYPTATFTSTGFTGDATGGTLSGTLTLHGVSRPIAIAVTPVGEGKDPWGGYRAGFEGHVKIPRAEFGLDRHVTPATALVDVDLYVEGIKH